MTAADYLVSIALPPEILEQLQVYQNEIGAKSLPDSIITILSNFCRARLETESDEFVVHPLISATLLEDEDPDDEPDEILYDFLEPCGDNC